MARESKKKAIMRALATHLEQISAENGYLNTVSGVFRGRTQFGDEVAPPFISILEAPRPIDPNGGGSGKVERQSQWTLLVQGFATDDRENPTDPAYDLLADTEACIARLFATDNQGLPAFPEEYNLGGFKIEVRVQEGIVRPPDNDISDTAFFYLPVVLDVVTNLREPYTAA